MIIIVNYIKSCTIYFCYWNHVSHLYFNITVSSITFSHLATRLAVMSKWNLTIIRANVRVLFSRIDVS